MSTVASAWRAGTKQLLLLRFFGFDTFTTGTGWPRWSSVVAWVLLVHFGPPAVLWVLSQFLGVPSAFPGTEGGRNALLFTLCLSAGVVVCSGAAWVLLERRMTWFDQFLPKASRKRAVKKLESLYRRQWLGGVIAVAGIAIVLLKDGLPPAYLPTNASAYYAMALLALTSGWAFVSSWWVPSLVTIVYRTKSDRLGFLPVQFASTPGVVLISEAVVMGAAALVVAIGFSLALWLYVRFSNALLPAYMEGSLLVIWLVLALVFVRVAVRPIFEIHLKLLEVKSRRLELLQRELNRVRSSAGASRRRRRARAQALIEEMAFVGESSTMPSRAVALLPFAAAVVGAVVALLFVWAFGEPPTPRIGVTIP